MTCKEKVELALVDDDLHFERLITSHQPFIFKGAQVETYVAAFTCQWQH